jgi:integron integrase
MDEEGGQPRCVSAAPRLLERVRDAIRRRHYSDRTEETYVHWIKRFIHFSGKRHPAEMGAEEVTAFLNYLAREREVAAATHNQALSALLFLYKEVLGQRLPWLDGLERARRPVRMPTVLTVAEVGRLLGAMRGTKWLMASLLYGAGLRLRECLKLRVKDVDFGYRQILVRDGKGAKDRVTMLPEPLIEPLEAHLARCKLLHERDLASGHGEVELPHALAREYPRAPYDWAGSSCFRPPSFGRTQRRKSPRAPRARGLGCFAQREVAQDGGVSRRQRNQRAVAARVQANEDFRACGRHREAAGRPDPAREAQRGDVAGGALESLDHAHADDVERALAVLLHARHRPGEKGARPLVPALRLSVAREGTRMGGADRQLDNRDCKERAQ